MHSPLIDTPQALDAAIAASHYARREKLVGAVRNQQIRTRAAAFALSGCIVILVAFFFAGDHKAAAPIAMMAMAFGVTCLAGKTGQKKAVDSLKEMERSM